MKYYIVWCAVLVLLLSVLLRCSSYTDKTGDESSSPSHVEIRKTNGEFQFYVNDQPFEVKGVGYGSRDGSTLDILSQSGGNTIRTWGTRNGKQLLDSAAKYDIMVAMGIGMGQQLHGFDYEDEKAVSAQFERIKKEVLEFKDHPNILCWVAGNELNLFFDEEGNRIMVNPKTYAAVGEVANFIHEVDPDHPVTTTFAEVRKDHIDIALKQCPQIDFLSLQVYTDLENIPELINNAEITMPYAITEFGPRGHWEMPSTEWGREIEETSTVKAAGITERMHIGFTNNKSGLCLGGFAFLWGNKQERTPTWYGTFLKSGEATERVDELANFWSGKYPENQAPKVDSFKLDNKYAAESIYLHPGDTYSATAFSYDPNGDELSYEWIMLKEVKARSQGGAREKEPEPENFEVLDEQAGSLMFIAPEKEGDYRLYAYVYDGKNKAGYANIPFYVKKVTK
jgi:hypothetical protein